jgi:hypothetical protein
LKLVEDAVRGEPVDERFARDVCRGVDKGPLAFREDVELVERRIAWANHLHRPSKSDKFGDETLTRDEARARLIETSAPSIAREIEKLEAERARSKPGARSSSGGRMATVDSLIRRLKVKQLDPYAITSLIEG